MKTYLRLFAVAAFTILPVAAFAQADQHHPDTGGGAAAARPDAAAPMTGDLPAQCAAMMPMMQQMMGMMATMHGQGGMQTQGGMMQGMPMDAAGMSAAAEGHMNAMSMMDAPMMPRAQAGDPDVSAP